jgi:23S rRNA pseudouridine2605 synthase
VSNTPEFNTEQLVVARSKSWHQNAEPLATLDSVRDWLVASGIVLFTPRPLQLPAPAPSLVEATLGAPSAGPTDQQIAAARTLVARLVAEGNALPLNLLGTPGDTPDFIVSAQVFSFVYTLRGDKAWKQAPSTSGATKSSPLGVRIFEVLTEKGALTAAELANELGRELTESAVQRALTELWSNLRVLPLYPQSAGPALWELTSRRFTKAIKAGINAGQPTALSALISLYLAQSLLATEDEIEVFLSPLAARSRIREVVHALNSSRQLETVVLEGKSLLHIPGTLPEFPEIEKPEPTEEELAAAATIAANLEGEGRIKKFSSSSERRSIGDFKGKPARTFGSKPAFGAGTRPTARAGSPRFGAKPDSERRPFKRVDAADKPSFTKPWDEDRKPSAEGDVPAKRPYTPRAANAGSSFAKKPYTPREGGAAKPFAKRPYTPRTEDGDAPKRPYTPRAANAGSTFAKKPYTPREGGSSTGSFAKRPYTPRDGASADRPARPSFGAKRTFGDKPAFGAKRPYTPRDGASSDRPARPSFGAKRTFGDKPAFGAKRPYTPREGGASDRPARSFGEDGPKPFRKFDAPKRPFTPREGGRPDKPAYGGSNSKPRAPKEEFRPERPASVPKRPFPRKEGDLADRPVRTWPSAPTKTGRSDGRPGGPGSKPRAPRKDFGDRESRPARPSFGEKRSFGDRDAKPAGRFGKSAPRSGGFSKRPASAGGTVSSDSKPFVRRGTPGVKPSFPRKPRSEE